MKEIRDTIGNNEELKVVREQLIRAELALGSLRRDILPKNEKIYQVMSEPCIEMILKLRTQIDEYLNGSH
jgi:hypothetical protein